MKSVGQIAYEAFESEIKSFNACHDYLRGYDWSDLPREVQVAWEDAALAVINSTALVSESPQTVSWAGATFVFPVGNETLVFHDRLVSRPINAANTADDKTKEL